MSQPKVRRWWSGPENRSRRSSRRVHRSGRLEGTAGAPRRSLATRPIALVAIGTHPCCLDRSALLRLAIPVINALRGTAPWTYWPALPLSP